MHTLSAIIALLVCIGALWELVDLFSEHDVLSYDDEDDPWGDDGSVF